MKNNESCTKRTNKSICYICNKKLSFYTIKCRCNKMYCNLHRYPEDHNCTYDYKSESKKKLEKELLENANSIKKIKVDKI